MPLLATGSALVAGSADTTQGERKVRTMKIKVLRAFCIQAKRVEPGKVIEVPHGLGLELIASRKAEHATDAEPAPAAKEKPNAGK